MNQSASAFLVLFVALLNCVFNPFFRRTRKGLFIVHWAFVNYITASRHYLDLTYNPGDLSLLAATLFVLVEHLSTRHCAGREVGFTERNIICLFLLASDIISYTLLPELRYFIRVLLTACVVLASYRLHFGEVRNPHKMNQTELEEIKHDDLFYSWSDPFSCLGRMGKLTLAVVLMNSSVQIYPILLRMSPLLYTIYVVRSVAPLGLLFAPGFFAGTVQSLKAIGRLVVELKAIRVEKVKTIADSDDPELTPAQQPTVIKLV
ncbi:hypothetical protein QR680_002684 [Steinernema hermaphroditum]|uniref:Uncharacterized protein n=1 Tax=Steinernema hermaphroditum TaxID=289476 RepID=A0AA39H4J9_9BILA|nr:hypothetical protein QR680_002684 [Steinernema hermaphroditum]